MSSNVVQKSHQIQRRTSWAQTVIVHCSMCGHKADVICNHWPKGNNARAIREESGSKVVIDPNITAGHQFVKLVGEPQGLRIALARSQISMFKSSTEVPRTWSGQPSKLRWRWEPDPFIQALQRRALAMVVFTAIWPRRGRMARRA